MSYKEFKIHTRRGDFFNVIIFDQPRAMRAFAKQLARESGVNMGSKQFVARIFIWTTEPKHFGVVLFCKKWAGVGTVSHEMLHAAIHCFRRWGRKLPRKGILKKDPAEEALCELHGNLVTQFWTEYYKAFP